MKLVQYSVDLKIWKTIGKWTDEESVENWKKLQQFIEDVQPFGFFRMINDIKN